MKFDCGPSYDEWRKYITNWHPFFAVWPRRVGSHDCRWLETIERRLNDRERGAGYRYYEYRAKNAAGPQHE